jgi:hypothetical protein
MVATGRVALAVGWAPPERITVNTTADVAAHGSLASIDADHVVAVWHEDIAGRILFAERTAFGWTYPEEVDRKENRGSAPHLALDGSGNAHVVWQHALGDSAEILYAYRSPLSGWSIDQLTMNMHADVSPAVACDGLGRPHVTWIGIEDATDSVRVFYAVRETMWTIGVVPGSTPPLSAPAPRVDTDPSNNPHIVYITYEEGGVGAHVHYAQSEGGSWTEQILASPNANDYTADLAVRGFTVHVAMSGHDTFGSPWHTYYRRSTDGGVSFGVPELSSGTILTQLDDLDATEAGVVVLVGSEVEGNFHTENLVFSQRTDGAWSSELLPPSDQASKNPSVTILQDREGGGGDVSVGVFYSSRGSRSAASDSAEVGIQCPATEGCHRGTPAAEQNPHQADS